MRKAEFVHLFVSAVQESRRRRFPDIRPSENAASAWDDKKAGERLWKKHRLTYQTMTREQVVEALRSTADQKGGK